MHQKVVDWLKEHSNISYDINFEHDYKKTKQFPQGSVKVELQLDEATFGKLSKFVNPEKVRDKSKKGMPPPDW